MPDERSPHSTQELCDRVRRGLIEMTDMPDAFDAFLKIERLLEQLEALREELCRVADGVVVLREDEIGTWAYALVSNPASSSLGEARDGVTPDGGDVASDEPRVSPSETSNQDTKGEA